MGKTYYLVDVAVCFDVKTMINVDCGRLFGGGRRGACPTFGEIELPEILEAKKPKAPVATSSASGSTYPYPEPNPSPYPIPEVPPYYPPKAANAPTTQVWLAETPNQKGNTSLIQCG